MWLLLTVIQIGQAFSFHLPQTTPQTQVAILPFLAKGIPKEDVIVLEAKFREALAETKRFNIMSESEMSSILLEANVSELDDCTYSYCIAHLGKILGVQRVFHAGISRQGRLYTVQVRIVDVLTEKIIYTETQEHSGAIEPLISDVIPAMARRAGEPRIQSSNLTRWYLIGAAAIGFGTAMYFLHKGLRSSGGMGEDPKPPTPD